MKYRKKPIVVEAITFSELVEHGRASGAHQVWGVPWSFEYGGWDITHENDDCYLIPTLEGTMRFERGDMLITGVRGEIYPCKLEIFAATYERADQGDREPITETQRLITRVLELEYALSQCAAAALKAEVLIRELREGKHGPA